MFLFDWLRYFVRAWWPGLLVLLALIALAAAYLSSALRSRGRPAVERRGAGLAGGFGGFGPMSRFGGGAGPFATPGSLQLYGRERPADFPEEKEDPRKR